MTQIEPSPAKNEAGAMTPMAAWKRADALANRSLARNPLDPLNNHETIAQAAILYARAAGEIADPRLHIRLGRCHHDLGDLAAAREDFGRALAIAPSNLPARFFLALAEFDAGDLAQAAQLWARVVEKHDENMAARCLLALTEYRLGRKAEALAVWERSFSANTDFLVRLTATLESERLSGGGGPHGPGARQVEVVEQPGATPWSQERSRRRLMAMATRALKEKDHDAALGALRRLARLHPRDPEARFALGCVALEAELFGEAESSLFLALRLQRREDARRSARGCRKATRPRLRKTLAKTSLHPGAQALRALALIRLGRCGEARDVLRRVPVEGPESYNRFYYLGLCTLAQGRPQEAMDCFRYAFTHYGVDTLELCLAELMAWARSEADEAPATD